MNAAADRLGDRNNRRKEERNVAARQQQQRQPKPYAEATTAASQQSASAAPPNPYAPYANSRPQQQQYQPGRPQPNFFNPSAGAASANPSYGNGGNYGNYAGANASSKANPTSASTNSSNYARHAYATAGAGAGFSEPEWSSNTEKPSAAHQPPPPSDKAQEAAKRKEYYDQILRDQFRKAEQDRKAKEYADIRDNLAKAKAKVQESVNNAHKAFDTQARKPLYGNVGAEAGTKNADYKAYGYFQQSAEAQKASGSSASSSSSSTSYSFNYAHPIKEPTAASSSSSSNSGSSGSGGTSNGPTAYKATADGKVEPKSTGAAAGQFSTGNRVDEHNIPTRAGLFTNAQASSSNSSNTAAAPSAAANNSNRSGSSGSSSNSSSSSTASTSSGGAAAATGSGAATGGSKARLVPRPYGLRCIFIGTSAAELEWVTSKYHRYKLLAELSWRNKDNGAKAVWESASKLIGSGRCRKKNLSAGAVYEFRVRAVEELSGGLLGARSDWSDAITVTLMPDKATPTISRVPSALGKSSIGLGLGSTKATSKSQMNLNPSLESLAANLSSSKSSFSKGSASESSATARDGSASTNAGAAAGSAGAGTKPAGISTIEEEVSGKWGDSSKSPSDPSKPSASTKSAADGSTSSPLSSEHKFERFSRGTKPTTERNPAAPSAPVNTRSASDKHVQQGQGQGQGQESVATLESKSTPVSPMHTVHRAAKEKAAGDAALAAGESGYGASKGGSSKEGASKGGGISESGSPSEILRSSSGDDTSPLYEMHKVRVDPHRRIPGTGAGAGEQKRKEPPRAGSASSSAARANGATAATGSVPMLTRSPSKTAWLEEDEEYGGNAPRGIDIPNKHDRKAKRGKGKVSGGKPASRDGDQSTLSDLEVDEEIEDSGDLGTPVGAGVKQRGSSSKDAADCAEVEEEENGTVVDHDDGDDGDDDSEYAGEDFHISPAEGAGKGKSKGKSKSKSKSKEGGAKKSSLHTESAEEVGSDEDIKQGLATHGAASQSRNKLKKKGSAANNPPGRAAAGAAAGGGVGGRSSATGGRRSAGTRSRLVTPSGKSPSGSASTSSSASPSKPTGGLQRKASKSKIKKPVAAESPIGEKRGVGSSGSEAQQQAAPHLGFSVDEDDNDKDNPFDDESFEMEQEQFFKLHVPKSLKDKQGRVRHFSANTYRHPVRAEPFSKSAPIGYLVPSQVVVACADCGDWLKVRIHAALKDGEQKSSKSRKVAQMVAENPDKLPWGWCVREDRAHEYLKLTLDSEVGAASEDQSGGGSGGGMKKSSGHNRVSAPQLGPHSPAGIPLNGTLGRTPMKHRSMRSIPKFYAAAAPDAPSPQPNNSGNSHPGADCRHHQHYRHDAHDGGRSLSPSAYVTPPSNKPGSQSAAAAAHHSQGSSVEEWMELYDDSGNLYYYNEATGASSWTPPDWVEEIDPSSGAP